MNTPEPGTKSEVANKWLGWRHNPCRLEGSPTPHSRGQNHKWPKNGLGGYITLAASGGPQHFTAGGKIGGGPQMG